MGAWAYHNCAWGGAGVGVVAEGGVGQAEASDEEVPGVLRKGVVVREVVVGAAQTPKLVRVKERAAELAAYALKVAARRGD